MNDQLVATADDIGAANAVNDASGEARSNNGHTVRGRQVLPAIMTTRLLSDTANQMFNPFLAVFAVGIGVSIQQLGVLLSIRSLSGLVGPLFGVLADRYGSLSVARAGLLLLAASLVGFSFSNSWLTALAAMVPMGVALGFIGPVLQAYVGGTIRFERRARTLSVAEYSWALAGIIGLSAMGWIISLVGWRGALLALATALVAAQFGLKFLPKPALVQAPPKGMGGRLPVLAWLGSSVVALLFFTMFNAMVVHGVWLTNAFGVDTRGLGMVSLVLGFADLAGAALVSVLGNRMNVIWLAVAASALCVAGYVWLAVSAPAGLVPVVVLLVIVRAGMQAAFVSMVTLISETAPQARGLVMATAAAFGQIGLAVAAVVGPAVYSNLGFGSVASVSAVGMGMAVGLLLLWRSKAQHTSTALPSVPQP